jgi:hypothetical protein
MDDFQIVVYIILVVLYIISRAMKARKKAMTPPPQRPGRPTVQDSAPVESPAPYNRPEQPKQLTFDVLLKEFTVYEEKDESKPAIPQTIKDVYRAEPVQQPPVNPYARYSRMTEDDDEAQSLETIGEEAQSLETIGEEAQSLESLVSYEDLYQSPGRVTDADTRKADENESRFKKYISLKSFDLHHAGRFRSLLSNPTSIRDAVVLKEILDRRYF